MRQRLSSARLLLPIVLGFWATNLEADTVLRVGSAAGEPGEEVALEFRGDLSEETRVVYVQFDVPAGAADFLRVDVRGTASEHARPRGVAYNPKFFKGGYLAGVRFDMQGQRSHVGPGQDLLLFRAMFRIRHDAAPGENGVALTYAESTAPNGLSLPTTFSGEARLSVLPPSRPRPVGRLGCASSAQGVTLSWSLAEEYDAIRVLREGHPLVELEGVAIGHTDTAPPGNRRYEVVGVRSDRESFGLACDVFVDVPRPESILDFRCTSADSGVRLSWMNGGAYDTVALFRNGQEIARVAGSTTSHEDVFESDLFTIYSARGSKDGVDTLPTSCRLNEVSDRFLLRADDVRAAPGQQGVEVAFFVTNPEPLSAFQVSLRVDPAAARIHDLSVNGTLSESAQYDYFAYQRTIIDQGETVAGIIFDFIPPIGFLFPPGGDQHFLTLRLDLPVDVESGETIPVELGRNGRTFGSPKLACALTEAADFPLLRNIVPELQEGSILVGQSPVPEVQGARALIGVGEGAGGGIGGPTGNTIQLTWQNGGAYDRIRVERDGALLEELPGAREAFVDSAPGAGAHRYRLVAVEGDRTSFPTVVWARPGGIPGTFLRGDADGDGVVLLADAVVVLEALLLDGPQPGCVDAADADDNGRIDLTDPLSILLHLFLGSGPLPPPGPEPWFDSTEDGLSCG